MRHDKTLEQLWNEGPAWTERFDPASINTFPPTTKRYLEHALAPGAKLSACARLTMTGTIKLDSGWCDFVAEQFIAWERGFVWAARAKVNGLPITGFDRLVDGEGAMRWKLLGLFPVVRAEGAEIARAAAGRLHAEAIWLPAVLLRPEVTWHDIDGTHTRASIEAHGEPSALELEVDDDGKLRSCSLARWGDLETGEFRYHPFGAFTDAERSFDGVTIPTQHRVGWRWGKPEFETEGEFFRCALVEVQYR